jgi:hypothetical protein
MMINLKYLKSITKNIVFFLLLSFFGCNNKDEVVFKAVSKEISNISFSNQITETDDLSILDYLYFYNGGGVAIGDINNDNLPDIFFANLLRKT